MADDWTIMPPTDAQLSFAAKLGIDIPTNASRGGVSILISDALAEPRPVSKSEWLGLLKKQADELGIVYDDNVKPAHLDALIGEVKTSRRWVLSVARHIFKAEWFWFSECIIPLPTIDAVAVGLLADEKCAQYIQRAWSSDSASFMNLVDRHDQESHDHWYFFTAGSGCSTNSKSFKRTVELLAAECPDLFE